MQFCHWSRPRMDHTDHWSKLKSKSYYHTQTPQGNYICYCRPQNYDIHGHKYGRRPFENPSNLGNSIYSHHFKKSDHPTLLNKSKNTLALVGSSELNRHLSEIGSLQLPAAHQWLSFREQGRMKKRVPSASSQRAKQGFKYWPQEKAKSSLKGSLGPKQPFLGLDHHDSKRSYNLNILYST